MEIGLGHEMKRYVGIGTVTYSVEVREKEAQSQLDTYAHRDKRIIPTSEALAQILSTFLRYLQHFLHSCL